MNDAIAGSDQTEEEFLTHEVSDDALEAAAGTEKAAHFTAAFCSGLSTCPA